MSRNELYDVDAIKTAYLLPFYAWLVVIQR